MSRGIDYFEGQCDLDQLGLIDFNFLILDEIQAIKNLNSRIAKAVMLLKGEYRFGLSGTPMENHVDEIYAVFRFLNPAMFGTFADFSRRYLTPIQKHNDRRAADMLVRKLSPFLLRRLKQDVASELPERTEQVLYADMEEAQAALYEERREFYRQAVLSSVKTEGFGKSGFLILQGLMELRQLASVPETPTDGEVISAKWQVFLNHLTEVIEGGHRCLVFTNFLATVELLSRKLDQLGVEQQAIDRTHRIGQTRNIFSYRIIARGTIEEKMLELQEQKKDLVLAAAKMLTHPDLFASFFEALSPPKQALLKEAVFDWGQNAVDLFLRLGLELPESKYSLYDFGKYPLDFLLDIGYDGGIRISWQLHSFAPFVSESDAWPVSTTAKERDRLAGLRLDFILKFLSTALLGKSREIPDPPELPAEPLSFLREKSAVFLSAPSLETDMKYFLPHMSISSKKDFMRRHGKERGKSLNELLPFAEPFDVGGVGEAVKGGHVSLLCYNISLPSTLITLKNQPIDIHPLTAKHPVPAL
ncbi:MAG: DEAD/DEAH box helicase [Spirochaetales bacterium]|nr:DEAD/DEAH box helicase [Spirochaetales bacterium]